MVPGWFYCSLPPSPANGSPDPAGISTNSVTCAQRNWAFIGLGLLLSVDLVLIPLVGAQTADRRPQTTRCPTPLRLRPAFAHPRRPACAKEGLLPAP